MHARAIPVMVRALRAWGDVEHSPRQCSLPGEHAVPETRRIVKDRDSKAILVLPVLRKGRLRDDT
eukprot:8224398-Alexandrium_andersonii.AAC.1